MIEKITKETLQILDALVGLIEQYMPSREVKEPYKMYGGEIIQVPPEGRVFEHRNMSTGEYALDVLMKYGLADDDGYSIVPNEKFYLLECYDNMSDEQIQKLLTELNNEETV
jgi:hypothetical protein